VSRLAGLMEYPSGLRGCIGPAASPRSFFISLRPLCLGGCRGSPQLCLLVSFRAYLGVTRAPNRVTAAAGLDTNVFSLVRAAALPITWRKAGIRTGMVGTGMQAWQGAAKDALGAYCGFRDLWVFLVRAGPPQCVTRARAMHITGSTGRPSRPKCVPGHGGFLTPFALRLPSHFRCLPVASRALGAPIVVDPVLTCCQDAAAPRLTSIQSLVNIQRATAQHPAEIWSSSSWHPHHSEIVTLVGLQVIASRHPVSIRS
jgi:hypothetical protein